MDQTKNCQNNKKPNLSVDNLKRLFLEKKQKKTNKNIYIIYISVFAILIDTYVGDVG